MGILVITTGGTIGALPYENIKNPTRIIEMPPQGQDYVRDALAQFPQYDLRCISHETRDSNLMDDAYRQGLVDLIKQAPEDKIVITHGTDGILQTANFFHRQAQSDPFYAKKAIVLTGAMVPLSCGDESDGLANLGFSFRKLSEGLDPDIYIVLCDYEEPRNKAGWSPQLYLYEPKTYEKLYNPEDQTRNRIWKFNKK